MSRAHAKPSDLRGQRVRIRVADAEVLGHYEAGPSAPERVQVRAGSIITIVPVEFVEVLR